MTKAPRYLVVQPDVTRPVGGNNVTLHLVETLKDAGYDISIIHESPSYDYPFYETSHRPYFYPPLASIREGYRGRRDKLTDWLSKLWTRKEAAINPELILQPDDVIVMPEFWYPEYSKIFPNNRKLLLAQAVFGFCRPLARDVEAGTSFIDDFEAAITISEAGKAAVEQFTNLTCHHVRQSVVRPTHVPTTPKKRQIAYMPRRRSEEIKIFLACVQRSEALKDWSFRPIHGVTVSEADAIMSESLIFLSFSHQEGFGLPPAEAMASGCLVIGYTGVAGEEFFTPETGFPILDSDITAFAATLESCVIEYDQDPTRLDKLRLHAADFMAKRYNPNEMRKTLLTAWAKIHGDLVA